MAMLEDLIHWWLLAPLSEDQALAQKEKKEVFYPNSHVLFCLSWSFSVPGKHMKDSKVHEHALFHSKPSSIPSVFMGYIATPYSNFAF